MDADDHTYPDDPNHPHTWGRPIVLSPEASKRAREMLNGPHPDWLTRALTRRVGRIEAIQRYVDHGRPYDPAEEV